MQPIPKSIYVRGNTSLLQWMGFISGLYQGTLVAQSYGRGIIFHGDVLAHCHTAVAKRRSVALDILSAVRTAWELGSKTKALWKKRSGTPGCLATWARTFVGPRVWFCEISQFAE